MLLSPDSWKCCVSVIKKKKVLRPSFAWGWGREGSSLFTEMHDAAFVF